MDEYLECIVRMLDLDNDDDIDELDDEVAMISNKISG